MSFPASYNECPLVTLNNVDISYINFEDLISDKTASARPKDLEDIAYLARKRQGN